MSYKVLIAEDEEIIRRGLVYALDWRKLGCGPILEASDGQEALEAIQTGDVDLVIMDINMPVLNGLRVLEETHAANPYAAIVLTGYSDFAYAQRALRCGAVDYLLKPVDVEELASSVKRACFERERRYTYAWLRQEGEKALYEPPTNLLPGPLGPGREADAAVSDVLRHIEAHYGEKITLAMLADKLYCSQSYLMRHFKEKMGMNFADYLNRFRIQQAMGLLQKGGQTIRDISLACGFSDYKYFNSVFQKYVGCSARSFIREIGNSLARRDEDSV